MRAKTQWKWTWQCQGSAVGDGHPLHSDGDQTAILGALLSDLLSTTARLTGVVPYGIACDVLAPLEVGDRISVHLSQEYVSASEFPQSFWLTYRAVSESSDTPALVGLIRGGHVRRW